MKPTVIVTIVLAAITWIFLAGGLFVKASLAYDKSEVACQQSTENRRKHDVLAKEVQIGMERVSKQLDRIESKIP
jgi:hypothetical protein